MVLNRFKIKWFIKEKYENILWIYKENGNKMKVNLVLLNFINFCVFNLSRRWILWNIIFGGKKLM